MNDLIKIEIKNGKETCSARDLHLFIESKQEFSNWIKKRINKYNFIENEDYISFDNIIKRENGATTRKEFYITIEMAKELSMIENNEKGKQARKYFIECEKKLKSSDRMELVFMEFMKQQNDFNLKLLEKIDNITKNKQIESNNQTSSVDISKPLRTQIVINIRQLANKLDNDFKTAWDMFYKEIYYILHINLNERSKNMGCEKLEYIDIHLSDELKNKCLQISYELLKKYI